MKIKVKNTSVGIIMPMFNSESTIIQALDSLTTQKYPVQEIVVVDNCSTDNSIKVVNNYTASHQRVKIRLIRNSKNEGVGYSYNLGASLIKTTYIVLMHSDSVLATNEELYKLIKPMLINKEIIASYAIVELPEKIWQRFNIWQKCLLVRAVGKATPGLNGKFDCIKRDEYLQIGGFDDKNFSGKQGFGGEDGDLHIRLKRNGKVVSSQAKVIHLHSLNNRYSLYSWIHNRKLLSRSYGRLLQIHGYKLGFSSISFFVKPILAIVIFIPGMKALGILLIVIYSIWYPWRIFITKSSWKDARIIVIPFIQIFLVYYETFWMIEAFFYPKQKA